MTVVLNIGDAGDLRGSTVVGVVGVVVDDVEGVEEVVDRSFL